MDINSFFEKLVIPVQLNAWHVFHPLDSFLTARGFLSLIVTLVFLASLFITTLKNNRFAFFSLFLIMIPLLPVLYIPGLGENPFAERYLYLPSVGFVMLVPRGLTYLAALKSKGNALIIGGVSLMMLLYSIGTVARNADWKDEYTFWTDAVKKSPEGPVPHYNLGCVLAAQGKLEEAIEQYKIAIDLKPAAVAYKSLGAAYSAGGLKDQAIDAYEHMLKLQPDHVVIHNELGSIYWETGSEDKAIEHFEAAVKLQPSFASAHYNLGMAYKARGLIGKALEHFETAVRLNPNEPAFWRRFGCHEI